MITIIAAMDRNGVIGKDGKIPWNYPEDLKWFKEQTIGSVCVMGRKTYESIPNGLPRRICYILSRKPYVGNKYGIAYSFKDEIMQRIDFYNKYHKLDTYIIGGAQVYKEFLDDADRLLITHIDKEFEGDTYFPLTNFDNYDKRIIKKSGDLTFVEYLKKRYE